MCIASGADIQYMYFQRTNNQDSFHGECNFSKLVRMNMNMYQFWLLLTITVLLEECSVLSYKWKEQTSQLKAFLSELGNERMNVIYIILYRYNMKQFDIQV